ncbi:MAG: hypothetical protein ACTS77_02275 [Arsenophonus sp. NC-TX2-MAG3]
MIDISKWEGISLSHLEQLFSKLHKTNYLAVFGDLAGYLLGRKEKIFLSLKLLLLLMNLFVQLTVREEKEHQDKERYLTHAP